MNNTPVPSSMKGYSFLKVIFGVILSVLILSLVGRFMLNEGLLSNRYYLGKVQENTQDALGKSTKELDEIKEILFQTSTNQLATIAQLKTNYPLFIYKKNALFYSSDKNLVSVLESYDRSSSQKLEAFSDKKSFFIINRARVFANMENYELVSLIPIYHQNIYNTSVFMSKPVEISLIASTNAQFNCYAFNKTFLFSVVPPTSLWND